MFGQIGPNQIFDFCFLILIETTQKEVIQIVNETKRSESKENNST